MSSTRPVRIRHVVLLLAVGWLTALTWMTTAGAAPAHAEDNSTTGFSVVVPPASPTPTPSESSPAPTDPPTSPQNPAPSRQSTPNTNHPSQNDDSDQEPDEPASEAPTEPDIPSTPASGDPAALDQEVYEAGGSVTVTASGFDPNEQVQVVLYSDPILIGNFAADEAGDISVTFTLPKDLLAGPHTVQLTGWASGHIATAQFLLGTAPLASAGGTGGVPPWAWWAGGAVAAAGLAYGGWRVLQVMRAPARSGGVGGEVIPA